MVFCVRRNGTKIQLKNVHADVTDELLKETLALYGEVKEMSRQNESVHALYSSAEEALQCVTSNTTHSHHA